MGQSMAKCSLLFCFVQIVHCTEVTPELIVALRCLMRVWLRRELVKYTDVSPAFQAKVDETLNTCTPELLASAGLPQDFYAAGHDLVWDVVNGWLSKEYTNLPPAQKQGDTFKYESNETKPIQTYCGLERTKINAWNRPWKSVIDNELTLSPIELVKLKFKLFHMTC